MNLVKLISETPLTLNRYMSPLSRVLMYSENTSAVALGLVVAEAPLLLVVVSGGELLLPASASCLKLSLILESCHSSLNMRSAGRERIGS